MPEDVSLGNNEEAPVSTSSTAPCADMNSGVGGTENDHLNLTSDSDTSVTITGKLTLNPGPEKRSPNSVPASRQARSFTRVGWFSPIESMFLLSMLDNYSPTEAYDLVKPLINPLPGDVAELPAKLRAIAGELEAAQSSETGITPAYITDSESNA